MPANAIELEKTTTANRKTLSATRCATTPERGALATATMSGATRMMPEMSPSHQVSQLMP